jgi:hypothetical protein
MKHHIESLLILVSFLAFGLTALFGVGIITLAIEVLSK